LLDIQGQSSPVVSQVAPVAPAPPPAANIPSVGNGPPLLTYAGAGLVVLFVLAAGGYLSFVNVQTKSLVDTRTRAVEQITAELGTPELSRLATVADQLKLGTAALQIAVEKPAVWSPLLAELAKRTSSGITLTSISVDESQHLRMNGTASSYPTLATFLATMTASEHFSDVELESSSLSESAQGAAISFAVKATTVPPTAVAATTPVLEADDNQ
jgi:Tfp pilus assembly protein PilN